MKTVKASSLDAPANRLAVHSDGFKLRQRDHAVLMGGDPRDPGLLSPFGAFLTHVSE
jgi:hypothetical protein